MQGDVFIIRYYGSCSRGLTSWYFYLWDAEPTCARAAERFRPGMENCFQIKTKCKFVCHRLKTIAEDAWFWHRDR